MREDRKQWRMPFAGRRHPTKNPLTVLDDGLGLTVLKIFHGKGAAPFLRQTWAGQEDNLNELLVRIDPSFRRFSEGSVGVSAILATHGLNVEAVGANAVTMQADYNTKYDTRPQVSNITHAPHESPQPILFPVHYIDTVYLHLATNPVLLCRHAYTRLPCITEWSSTAC